MHASGRAARRLRVQPCRNQNPARQLLNRNALSTIRRRLGRAAALTVAAVSTLISAGCAPGGVQWRYDFASAYSRSKAENRLTLVYFRQWFLPLCGKVEETVFSTPELRQATSDVTCIRYEMYVGDPLSAAWGVEAAPAFVIVDTDGRRLARGRGEFTSAEVIQAIEKARRAKFGPGTRSAPPP